MALYRFWASDAGSETLARFLDILKPGRTPPGWAAADPTRGAAGRLVVGAAAAAPDLLVIDCCRGAVVAVAGGARIPRKSEGAAPCARGARLSGVSQPLAASSKSSKM